MVTDDTLRRRTKLVLELMAVVGAVARGSTVKVAVQTPEQVGQVHDWCRASGNTVLAVHDDSVEIFRGSLVDTSAALAPEQMPGYRLWLYTNFHCNLACDYCCVASSPGAEPWALTAAQAHQLLSVAVAHGTREVFLTGGEPFLNPDIAEIAAAAVAAAPTVLLTNGMLLRGSRLSWLDAMPREGLVLQISVDSATPDLHDLHRGAGSWQRAMDGVRTAKEHGFQVRLAATLATDGTGDESALGQMCADLGLAEGELIVRRIAQQGAATRGIAISRATVVPEVCVTGRGIYWHPVAATDPKMKVADALDDLSGAIDEIRGEYLGYRRKGDILAATFPCA